MSACPLSPARQRNLIRYWIGENRLPCPSRAVLERIREEMLASRPDASPCVHWPGAETRRYRDHLYVMPPLPTQNTAERIPWNLDTPLTLERQQGVLTATPASGEGLRDTASQ